MVAAEHIFNVEKRKLAAAGIELDGWTMQCHVYVPQLALGPSCLLDEAGQRTATAHWWVVWWPLFPCLAVCKMINNQWERDFSTCCIRLWHWPLVILRLLQSSSAFAPTRWLLLPQVHWKFVILMICFFLWRCMCVSIYYIFRLSPFIVLIYFGLISIMLFIIIVQKLTHYYFFNHDSQPRIRVSS